MRDTDSARTAAPLRLDSTGTAVRLTPDSAESMRLKPDPTAVVEVDSLHEQPARIAYAEPTIFASAIEEPRQRSGLGIWFASAASLVLGIVIGFASGYRAAQGSSGAPATIESPAPTSGSASPGQPFSESSVPEAAPPKVEATPSPAPKEIVAEPKAPTATTPTTPTVPAPRPARVAPRQAVPPPAVVEEKPPLTGPASLQVASRPGGAEVIVDGKSVGRTPLSMEMSPGSHEVRLSLPGFKSWTTTVDVKPGITVRVSGSLEQ